MEDSELVELRQDNDRLARGAILFLAGTMFFNFTSQRIHLSEEVVRSGAYRVGSETYSSPSHVFMDVEQTIMGDDAVALKIPNSCYMQYHLDKLTHGDILLWKQVKDHTLKDLVLRFVPGLHWNPRRVNDEYKIAPKQTTLDGYV